MNILRAFICLCFIGFAHAGGDPHFAIEPPSSANSETPADELIRSVIAKPPVTHQQADVQQEDQSLTAKEWAKQAEHRSVELRALQHQLEVAKLNADIATSRKACRLAGAENCPLAGGLLHAAIQEVAHFVPKVIGISGSKAQIFDGTSLVWVLEGQRVANYVVDRVLLDSVVLLSPSGRKVYQNIGMPKAVVPDE